MKTAALAVILGLLPFGAHAQFSPLQKRMGEGPSQATQLMKAVSANPIASGFAVETVRRSYWDGSRWTLESETRNTFTGDRRTESAYYDVTGPSPVPAHRTSYDAYGNVQGFDQWDVDSQSFIPYERHTYSLVFDPVHNRFVTEQMIREVWSGAWENAERISFTLEVDNTAGVHIIGGMNEYWENTSWRPSMRFTLNQSGADVVEASQTRLGTEWRDAERTTYHGQTVAGLYNLLIDLLTEFEDLYDLNITFLMFPDATTEYWTGTRWTNVYRQFVDAVHTPSGRPTAVRYQEWDGAKWIDESRQEATYAEAAGEYRPSTSMLIDIDEGQAFNFLAEAYTYDGTGLLATADQQLNFGFGMEAFGRIEYTWKALSVGVDEAPVVSSRNRLQPAYPNPFTTSTKISYQLASTDDVRIRVYDMLGREVQSLVTARQVAGTYSTDFNAASLTSGLYVVRLETSAGVQSRTLTLVR